MSVTNPSAPLNLVATVIGDAVILTWVASPDPAVAHIIEVGSVAGGANLANFSTGSAATSFSASGVPPGTYFVRVRVVTSAAVSPASNEAVFVVVGGPCGLPSAPVLILTANSGGSLAFAWTIPSGTVTGFRLEAGTAPNLTNLGGTDLVGTTFSTVGVPAGTYYARVRARNTCGIGPASNELVVVVSGLPGLPFVFAVTANTYPETTPNLDDACRQEFGPLARLADWNRIVEFVRQGGSIVEFANLVGMTQRIIIPDQCIMCRWVSLAGSRFASPSRHFFIHRMDHNVPPTFLVHADIDANFLVLGSWFGFRMPALCTTPG